MFTTVLLSVGELGNTSMKVWLSSKDGIILDCSVIKPIKTDKNILLRSEGKI